MMPAQQLIDAMSAAGLELRRAPDGRYFVEVCGRQTDVFSSPASAMIAGAILATNTIRELDWELRAVGDDGIAAPGQDRRPSLD